MSNASEFNTRFKLDLFNTLPDLLFYEQCKQLYLQTISINTENNAITGKINKRGFIYNGNTYPTSGNETSNKVYALLDESLYDKAGQLQKMYEYIKYAQQEIREYMRKCFMLSKTLGDFFILMPQSFHAQIICLIRDYVPGSPVTLSITDIEQFKEDNKQNLFKFKKYLMLKLLIK